MSNYYPENYDIEYFRSPSSNNHQIDRFVPSIESLKSAQDIIRRYEKKRRAVLKRELQRRGAVAPPRPVMGMAIAVDDPIMPFRSRVWASPSSRLSGARPSSPPDTPSPAPRARRVSLQRDALRASRPVPPQPAPMGCKPPAIPDGGQSGILERLGVMAIQGLAVVLGLSGLMVLLQVF